ncbi:MAG: acetylxylan esterase, partial [Acidobacteria bacterium]|nr:acetylxylan esterase [Acidobacteriota bacterium]
MARAVAAPAGPRVLAEGTLPRDSRLGPLKDLNGYFPFTPPASREAWEARAAQLRRQLLVATGLWPMPARTAPQAVIHGLVERDGYTVEKVYFQSFPGHFVTGNLYRPKGRSGPLPAVLSAHGHWPGGRFQEKSPKEWKQDLVSGAERFESSARFPLQARAAQLARMGLVTFFYDMVGYADSVQIPEEVAHRFAKARPHMEGREGWGYFSTQAELRLQDIMGLQTYNSLRALDWLSELPDVDPARIAMTGESGGATQTFVLSAIDPRVAVVFPAVMVSTAMQGGCTCENAPYLRVGTGNVELAALIAPRPLGMTSADDWTKEFETKGFPDLQRLFALLGAQDKVMLTPLTHFGHNYNYVSRAAMYGWLNTHLKLGLPEPVIEPDFSPLTIAEASVWNAAHPKPAGGEEYERTLLAAIARDSDRQLAALTPTDAPSLARFRDVVGGAVDTIIGRRIPADDSVSAETVAEHARDGYRERRLLIRNRDGEELPAILLVAGPAGATRTPGRAVVWVTERGKTSLFDAAGSPTDAVRRLLAAGVSVLGVDLLYQGEFLEHEQAPVTARRVENPREFAGYTLGYNHPLFAQRVHDVLSAIGFLRGLAGADRVTGVDLIGVAGGGAIAAAARAQAGDAVASAAIDTEGFRFATAGALNDPSFLPGVVKYGDVPALLAVGAPGRLWLAGED